MTPKGGYFDKKSKSIVWPNYTKMREIKKFTEMSYDLAVELVDGIYLFILEHEKIR
jgi:hypothetical protein